MSWIAFFFLLYGLSWSLVGAFRWYAINKGLLDQPNNRSSHYVPTARGGGIVFCLGWVALMGVLHYYAALQIKYIWLFLPALIVGLTGFWDDREGLSVTTRLTVQVLAAITCLFMLPEGGELIQAWLPISLPLPVCFIFLSLAIVWMTNLYNFMDGSDGLAAMEGIFLFALGGYFLYQAEAYELVMLAWGMVALLAGFLTWNWPVARIFMGDSGSGFLGFTIAIFALASYKFYQVPLTLWLIMTGLFWFDATVTLVRRILARENWREPHRSHAYQRLLKAGWSHQKVLIASMLANAALGGLALIAYNDSRLTLFALGLAVTLLTCLYIIVEIIRPMYFMWYDGQKQEAD